MDSMRSVENTMSANISEETKKEIQTTLENIKQEPVSCDETIINNVKNSIEAKKSKRIKKDKTKKSTNKIKNFKD